MTATTTFKSLEQKRAEHAWNVIEAIARSAGADGKEKFVQQAKKLPSRILTSGLGQAMAFLAAKNECPELQRALNDWIGAQAWARLHAETLKPDATLIDRIIHGDSAFLRMATREAIAYLQWLNRFAEAQLEN